MSKDLLIKYFLTAVLVCLSGCLSTISKPIGLAAKAVVVPVKAVVGVAADVVEKPMRKTSELVRPITPVIQVR